MDKIGGFIEDTGTAEDLLLAQIDRVEAFKLQITKFHTDLNAVSTTSPVVSKTLENMTLLERDFGKLTSQLRNIRCKIQDEESGLNSQVQNLNDTVSNLKQELQKTIDEMTVIGDRSQSLELKVKTLNEAVRSNQNHDTDILMQNMRQELHELSDKVDNLESESRKLKKEIEVKDHQLYEKTMNIAALNEELDQLLNKADEDTQERVRESIKRTLIEDSDEEEANLPDDAKQLAGLKKQQLISMNLRIRNEMIKLKEQIQGYEEHVSQLKLEIGKLKSSIEGVGFDRTSMGRQSFGLDANVLNMRNSDMLMMFKKLNEEVNKPIDESELTAPDSTPEQEQPLLDPPLGNSGREVIVEIVKEVPVEVRMDQEEKENYENTIKKLKEQVESLKENKERVEVEVFVPVEKVVEVPVEVVVERAVEIPVHLGDQEKAEYQKVIEDLKVQLENAKREAERHSEHANLYPASIKQDPVEAMALSKLSLEQSQIAESKIVVDPTQSIIQTEENLSVSFGKPVDPLYESHVNFDRKKSIEVDGPKIGLSSLATSTIMQDPSTAERIERLQTGLSSLAQSSIASKSKAEKNPQELALRKMNKEFSILQIRIKDIQKKIASNDKLLLEVRAEHEHAIAAKVEQKVVEEVKNRLVDLTAEQEKLNIELIGCQDIEGQLMQGISTVLADIEKAAGGDKVPEKIEATLHQSKIIMETHEKLEESIRKTKESEHSPGAALGHVDHSKLEVPHVQASGLSESQAMTGNFNTFSQNPSFPQHIQTPTNAHVPTATSTIQATDRQVIRIKKKQNMNEKLSTL